MEQVSINKNITLTGENKLTTIIQAPVTMNLDCTSPLLINSPIVCVNGATNATIQGFTVDGLLSAGLQPRLMGIAFRDAGGVIQDNIVKNICYQTDVDPQCDPDGAEEGVGIYVYNSDLATTKTVNILNNTVTTFNKNGITVTSQSSWAPVTFLIQGNTITGLGVNQTTIQNGIQVELPKGSGSITSNIISEIAFNNSVNPNPLVANSVLLINTAIFQTMGVTTDANTMNNAQGGVYYFDSQGIVSNNTITVIKPGVAGKIAYGILASDPPWAVPSPYESTFINGEQQTNSLNVVAPLDFRAVEAFSNTVTFSGVSNTNTVGIAANAGLANSNLDMNFHNNSVTGFADGIGIYYCVEIICPIGTYTGINLVSNNLFNNGNGIKFTGQYQNLVDFPFAPVIHHNRIVGNTYGIYNDAYDYVSGQNIPITAENNWWGCNTGPDTTGCDASDIFLSVDFNPWLKLNTAANPTTIPVGGTSILTADLKFNSDAIDTSGSGFVLDGIPVTFSAATLGSVNPLSGGTLSGTASTTFIAPFVDGAFQACATVDNEAVCSSVTVEPGFLIFLPLISK